MLFMLARSTPAWFCPNPKLCRVGNLHLAASQSPFSDSFGAQMRSTARAAAPTMQTLVQAQRMLCCVFLCKASSHLILTVVSWTQTTRHILQPP
jgi:hypothetical protein